MNPFRILFLLVFLITAGNIFSQYQNVLISTYYNPNETSIMINPKNPNQIVAGANTLSPNSWSGYYYSTNGGLNWTTGFLSSTAAFPSGDPVIIVDTLGHFYYIQNANGWNHQPAFDVHLVCKSTNGGMNWSNGVTYGKNGDKLQDKPWGCVDLSHGPYGNYIYITWTEFDVYMSYNPLDSSRILFTRSTDGGQSFSIPKRISRWGGNAIDSSNTVEGAVPCVGVNGEVFVSWAGPLGICFNKSTNAGLTWLSSEITAVPPYPGGWAYSIPGILRCNGMPITCCDVSNGPYIGTIYINWSDQRNGPDDTDIWLVKSTNGGLNWSSPKRVNNDAPGKHQFLTWMSVDPVTGYIYIVFYDRRNYTTLLTDVYLARSTDGGQTFGNVKISQTAYLPIGYAWIGDYNGISAYNNKVRPIWTRMDNNNTSIYTAIIDSLTIGVTKISDNIPKDYQLGQNYPNPFNPETKIQYEIPKTGFVSLKIYDIRGREIKTLVEENQSAGEYELNFNAGNLPSGTYFYRIHTDKFSDTKKMVLIR
jgi:hypothetical protein